MLAEGVRELLGETADGLAGIVPFGMRQARDQERSPVEVCDVGPACEFQRSPS